MLTTALLEEHKVKGSSPFLLHSLGYCEGPVYITLVTALILYPYPSQKGLFRLHLPSCNCCMIVPTDPRLSIFLDIWVYNKALGLVGHYSGEAT